jgi:prepilin-type N-terminal cleavage/methylation domain-containing protein
VVENFFQKIERRIKRMKSLLKNKKGFTLIELIAVIVILGILAGVAVPKFLDLSTQAKQAVCDSNRGAIEAAVAMKYAENAVNGNAEYPASITADMFADGVIPECPFGVAYVYDNTTGRVATANHTH